MKIIAPFIILYLLVFISYAQQMNVEILAGPNVSAMHGDWIYSTKERHSKFSLSTGLAFNYSLKENLILSVKGLFERKGYTAKINFRYYNDQSPSEPISYEETIRYNADYITLPVTVQFTRGKKIKYAGEAGVFGSTLLKHSAKYKSSESSKSDETDFYKKIDAGISFGIRTSIPLTKKLNFNVSLLDNLGLVNTSKVSGEKVRTNTLNLFTSLSIQL